MEIPVEAQQFLTDGGICVERQAREGIYLRTTYACGCERLDNLRTGTGGHAVMCEDVAHAFPDMWYRLQDRSTVRGRRA